MYMCILFYTCERVFLTGFYGFYQVVADILPQTLQVNAQLLVICFHLQLSIFLSRYILTKY